MGGAEARLGGEGEHPGYSWRGPLGPTHEGPGESTCALPGFPGHTPPLLLGNGSARAQVFCGSLRPACATSGRPEAAGRAVARIQGLEGPQTLWSLSGLPGPSGRLGLSGRPGRPSFGAKKSRKPRGHGKKGCLAGARAKGAAGRWPRARPGDGSHPPPRLAACTGSQGWPPLGRVTASAAARPGVLPGRLPRLAQPSASRHLCRAAGCFVQSIRCKPAPPSWSHQSRPGTEHPGGYPREAGSVIVRGWGDAGG